jgi:hypothetical protein
MPLDATSLARDFATMASDLPDSVAFLAQGALAAFTLTDIVADAQRIGDKLELDGMPDDCDLVLTVNLASCPNVIARGRRLTYHGQGYSVETITPDPGNPVCVNLACKAL